MRFNNTKKDKYIGKKVFFQNEWKNILLKSKIFPDQYLTVGVKGWISSTIGVEVPIDIKTLENRFWYMTIEEIENCLIK